MLSVAEKYIRNLNSDAGAADLPPVDPRFVALLARKPARVASVAIANKMARIAWAVMARGGVFVLTVLLTFFLGLRKTGLAIVVLPF